MEIKNSSVKLVAIATGVAVALALMGAGVITPTTEESCTKETHYITPAGYFHSGYDYGTDLEKARELAGSASLVPLEVCN